MGGGKIPVILVVDDTTENLDIVVDLLSEYDVRDVTDAMSALAVLRSTPVDLILLDIVMPEIDGFTLCRMIQDDEATRNIPIIFITAMADEDSIERAYEAGGKDYVTKPFKPRELLSRVRTQLELRRMMNNLEFLAFQDPLTGICNRRRFYDLANAQFARPAAMHAVMLDIDHFKAINDHHGHAAGDEILTRVAEEAAGRLPAEAVFGRIGGEEFAMILPDGDDGSVLRLVEDIRQSVAALPIQVAGRNVRCTVSCGIARKEPATRSLDELLQAADAALYDAKHLGRNRSVFRQRESVTA